MGLTILYMKRGEARGYDEIYRSTLSLREAGEIVFIR